MYINDTIIAQSSPPGYGGVSVVRISGPKVIDISFFVLGKLPVPRYADYVSFYGKGKKLIDKGISIYFQKPNSYTGEDVLELQGHGGPVVVDLLMKEILDFFKYEVRIANPGEFSKRAFLNKKMDLTQAEAVIDLINASSIKSAQLALNSLDGSFSVLIKKIIKNLNNLRLYIESSIDFSNESIVCLNKKKISIKLDNLIIKLENLISQSNNSRLLKEYIKVVITGFPNVGKSTLFNRLCENNLAIVTNIPGTTRDILKEYIYIDGVPICIVDTAGLCNTENSIESIGIEKALDELKKADHILYVFDDFVSNFFSLEKRFLDFFKSIEKKIPMTFVRNKIDIFGKKVNKNNLNEKFFISISAYQNKGINILKNYLKDFINHKYSEIGTFLAKRRHIQSLLLAKDHLLKAKKNLLIGFEDLLAEELLLSKNCLEEIIGKSTSNDLLNEIFSNFCVGK